MQTNFIGFDAGNGAIKLYGATGGLEVLSQVSTNGSKQVVSTFGLHKQKAPMHILNPFGSFYVGAGAHDWGRPVESLDAERNNGTPEMESLLNGSLTQLIKCYGELTSPLSLVIGLPQEALTGDQANTTRDSVRRWLIGTHTWEADDKPYAVEIANVKIASQVTGALFDYLLDENGKFIQERKRAFTEEVGVISIGFGTVEMLVIKNRAIVQRFTLGTASGVRRLLEIADSQKMYSLGESDLRLRQGKVDLSTALPIWEREVTGVIEKQWGNYWKRFAAILLVGGGTILLKNTLPYRFNGKAFIPDDPILSVARGLYKMTLSNKEK